MKNTISGQFPFKIRKKVYFFFVFMFLVIFSLLAFEKNKQERKLNVVFGINNRYVDYAKVAIDSIVTNNVSGSHYVFWILSTDISDENKKKMKKYAQSVNQEIVFVTIDSKYTEKWNKMSSFWPSIIMARLLIPEVLPQSVKKALYLDADVLVAEDLKNLFDINVENYYAAMVEDAVPQLHQLELLKGRKYANSGVILFNLNKMRQDKIPQLLWKYLDENFERFSCKEGPSCYTFKDQDLINLVLKDGIKFIDLKWNNQDLMKWQDVSDSNREGIYHFVSSENKPWVSIKSGAHELWIHQEILLRQRERKGL